MHNFLKVTVAIPALVATARRLLGGGILLSSGRRSFQTYESNVPFALRFMINSGMQGASWIELPAGKYQHNRKKLSRCQYELNCVTRDLICHAPEGDWQDNAPLRILSFDIECAGRRGFFPTPDKDPVIQIANTISCFGDKEPLFKNVFTLDTCSSIVGADVLEHKTEQQLLSQWMEFFQTVDADIITGYNIINFDLPYILERGSALKLKKFNYMGRLLETQTRIKDSTFSSKAYGTRENKEMNIEGRVQFDLLPILRREYKLRSYSLNSVSAHFLNMTKEDVHHSIITDLQNGTCETRHRLAVYCLKDAVLPQRLLDKLMLLVNYIEMARVTGVPLTYLITRGQQIKVVSQLLRKARAQNLVIPVLERNVTDEKYEGATVIEPKRGYYSSPVTTLDFASLYPSIMMAHNLCYSTLINVAEAKAKLREDQYVITPRGDCFVTADTQKGLLPEILSELLSARKVAKKAMKEAKDPFTRAIQNGRQLALKISANSVYGFTGAQVGQLPCMAISSSVTAFGREMIEATKNYVENHYTVANGFEFDAEVVYGDTDSVMIKFGHEDLETSMQLGREAADLITEIFQKPIKLEFEKVYWPYLLINKKRYAGLYWTQPDKWDKMDCKGIETVRRDNCAMVGNVITYCLDKILIERDIEGAITYTKKIISDLLMNRLDLSWLVISKSLGKSAQSEEYTNKQAHVELAERMRKRDPSTAPVVGDRVAYVITKMGKGARAYEKAEDPIYVLEHDVPVDAEYYLHNQLQGPLTRIFEPILGSRTSSLFAGDHTRSVKILTPSASSGGIMRFAVKKKTCLGCKVPLSGNQKVVCNHCQANQAALYIKELAHVRNFEKGYSKLWTQCQSCQGSLHQEILCTSRDCPIFYRRKKVQKDLKRAQDKLNQFAF